MDNSTCIEEFSKGELWIGGFSGLSYLRDSANQIKLTRYRMDVDGLDKPDMNIQKVVETDDAVWILNGVGMMTRVEKPPMPGYLRTQSAY